MNLEPTELHVLVVSGRISIVAQRGSTTTIGVIWGYIGVI